MSRLARRTVFAAPLVVTASLGCGSKSDKPKAALDAAPVARVAIDATVARAAPDAAPALPDAPDGAQTIQIANGFCFLLPPKDGAQAQVKCPDTGPTLLAALTNQRDRISRYQNGPWPGFVAGAASCMLESGVQCPPPDQATCNPPPPQDVPCPDDMIVHLGPGIEPTKRDGNTCFWNDVQVVCPKTPAELYGYVHAQGKGCVFEAPFDCPPSAGCNPPPARPIACPDPDAKLPAIPPGKGVLNVRDDGTCWYEPETTCPPNVACNPPEPMQVTCPTQGMATKPPPPPPTNPKYGWIEHQGKKNCVWQEPFECPPNAKCNPPEPRSVPCPDEKAEAKLDPPPAGGGNVFVREDGSCWFSYDDDCPPGDSCNPAPPDRVRCPTK